MMDGLNPEFFEGKVVRDIEAGDGRFLISFTDGTRLTVIMYAPEGGQLLYEVEGSMDVEYDAEATA